MINPFFEVNNETYHIVKTINLEIEYTKLREQSQLSAEDISIFDNVKRANDEYIGVKAKYEEAKNNFYNNPLDKDTKEIYQIFKDLEREKYQELTDISLKSESLRKKTVEFEESFYNTGIKILTMSLYDSSNNKLDNETALNVWKEYEQKSGLKVAKEWLLAMLEELFNNGDDTTDPFLQKMRAKKKTK